MDMIRCPKCGTYHYGNDPCPEEILMDIEHFNHGIAGRMDPTTGVTGELRGKVAMLQHQRTAETTTDD